MLDQMKNTIKWITKIKINQSKYVFVFYHLNFLKKISVLNLQSPPLRPVLLHFLSAAENVLWWTKSSQQKIQACEQHGGALLFPDKAYCFDKLLSLRSEASNAFDPLIQKSVCFPGWKSLCISHRRGSSRRGKKHGRRWESSGAMSLSISLASLLGSIYLKYWFLSLSLFPYLYRSPVCLIISDSEACSPSTESIAWDKAANVYPQRFLFYIRCWYVRALEFKLIRQSQCALHDKSERKMEKTLISCDQTSL